MGMARDDGLHIRTDPNIYPSNDALTQASTYHVFFHPVTPLPPPLTLEDLTRMSPERKKVLDMIVGKINNQSQNLDETRQKYIELYSNKKLNKYDLFRDTQYHPKILQWLQNESTFWNEQTAKLPDDCDPGEGGNHIARWMTTFLTAEWQRWEKHDCCDRAEGESLKAMLNQRREEIGLSPIDAETHQSAAFNLS